MLMATGGQAQSAPFHFADLAAAASSRQNLNIYLDHIWQ